MNTRAVLLLLVVMSAFVLAAVPAGAQTMDDVEVVVEPSSAPVVLGETLDISVTVTNNGTAPSAPLVVHIDITDPSSESSVDPEDWTSTLSKTAGVVAPGATKTVTWNIQPISGGSFSLYAVALSEGVSSVASSNVLAVDVADQRSLNPGGILPVAIGVPLVVGFLLLVQIRLARRPRKPMALTSA